MFVILRVARKALFRVWRRACARRALLRGGMGRGVASRPDGVELKRIAVRRSGASQFSWFKSRAFHGTPWTQDTVFTELTELVSW